MLAERSCFSDSSLKMLNRQPCGPQPVPPGAHLKSPLAAVHFESTRTRSVELNRIEVLTNEGLSVAHQAAQVNKAALSQPSLLRKGIAELL